MHSGTIIQRPKTKIGACTRELHELPEPTDDKTGKAYNDKLREHRQRSTNLVSEADASKVTFDEETFDEETESAYAPPVKPPKVAPTQKSVRFNAEISDQETQDEENELHNIRMYQLKLKALDEQKAEEVITPKADPEEEMKKLQKEMLPGLVEEFINSMFEMGYGKAFHKYYSHYQEYTGRWFRFAIKVWFKSFGTDCHSINKEQFADVCYETLCDDGFLSSNYYLRGFTREHLEKLYDIYTWSTDNLSMDPTLFCHAFLFLLRENVTKEVTEISLAQTLDALHSQQLILKGRIKLLPRAHLEDWFNHNPNAGAIISLEEGFEYVIPKIEVTLEDGTKQTKESERVSFGLYPILHVQHKSGKILHFPILYTKSLSISDNSKEIVCFADVQGTAYKDLSHLDKLISDLQSFPDGKLLDALMEDQPRKLQSTLEPIKPWLKRVNPAEKKDESGNQKPTDAPQAASTQALPNLFKPIPTKNTAAEDQTCLNESSNRTKQGP